MFRRATVSMASASARASMAVAVPASRCASSALNRLAHSAPSSASARAWLGSGSVLSGKGEAQCRAPPPHARLRRLGSLGAVVRALELGLQRRYSLFEP